LTRWWLAGAQSAQWLQLFWLYSSMKRNSHGESDISVTFKIWVVDNQRFRRTDHLATTQSRDINPNNNATEAIPHTGSEPISGEQNDIDNLNLDLFEAERDNQDYFFTAMNNLDVLV